MKQNPAANAGLKQVAENAKPPPFHVVAQGDCGITLFPIVVRAEIYEAAEQAAIQQCNADYELVEDGHCGFTAATILNQDDLLEIIKKREHEPETAAT